MPYSIRVSQDGELFAVDAVNSNIVRITPPLSQCKLSHYFSPSPKSNNSSTNYTILMNTDSRARLIAGSFQGYTGHVDGKPNDARFDHPKGVTMDDKGNVYVADTSNLAIRKIGEAGLRSISPHKSTPLQRLLKNGFIYRCDNNCWRQIKCSRIQRWPK